MSGSQHQLLTVRVPYKTVAQVERMAAEYGISRANLILHFIELGLKDMGAPLEVSTTNIDGERTKAGIPINVQTTRRKLL